MFTVPSFYLFLRASSGKVSRTTAELSTAFSEILKLNVNDEKSLVIRRRAAAFPMQSLQQVIFDATDYVAFSQDKYSVNLTDWTAYLQSQLKSSSSKTPKIRPYNVLLETSHPQDEEAFLNQILEIPAGERVELLNVCEPMAWLSGDPFSIVCKCSEDELMRMTDALMRSCLVMDEMLQIDKLALVDLVGEAHLLLPPDSKNFLTRIPSSSNTALLATPSPSDREVFTMSHLEATQPHSVTQNSTCDKDKFGPSGDCHIPVDKEKSRSDKTSATKSPNILVYTGKKLASSIFNEIKQLCIKCLGANSYTIYHLKHDQVCTDPWQDNCSLLIIAVEQIYDGVDTKFSQFFYSGGKVLSFCSNLDRDFLTKTENPNCNQIKVVRARFTELNEDVYAVQGRHHYTSTESLMPNTHAHALFYNDTQQLVVVGVANSQGGYCIFTQIHLERSPSQSAVTSDMFTQLTSTDDVRVISIGELLKSLGIQKGENQCYQPVATICYINFIHSESCGKEFISKVLKTHRSKTSESVLTIPNVAEYHLASCINDTEGLFNWQAYKKGLTSQAMGNTVIFQEISNSTQNLLEPFLFICPADCGMVAISNQQLAGVGRGGNSWLSPPGSVAMSFHLRVDMSTPLGKSPAMIQTIPALAVALAAQEILPKMKQMDDRVRVKWPNDIYYKKIKIGGVLVKSSVLQTTMNAVVGVGVNISNPKPTVSFNDVIDEYNEQTDSNVPHVTVEFMAARILSHAEQLVELLQQNKTEYLNEYYRNWMHSGTRVDVPHENIKDALIIGLDEHGFLLLQTDDGSTFSVQPDGNSFDIMHNLIKLK